VGYDAVMQRIAVWGDSRPRVPIGRGGGVDWAFNARCRGRLSAALGLLIATLAGCGTVLPPLDEPDGSTTPIEEDAETGVEDVEEEGTPIDEDASESDSSLDAPIEGGQDACPDCDARQDRVPSPDVTDARLPDAPGDGRVTDAPADVRIADGDGASCPSPVDCAVPACNGVSCGANGLICKSAICACPGGQAKETSCSDGIDNDCDGLKDCADPDCARQQCGASTNQRCCGTTCVNTETDSANCQGCGLACAAGHTCKRITDVHGTRGACTCAGTSSLCPKHPGQVCRVGNNDGQDNICACDFPNQGNAGCAAGQVCREVEGANFCRY
jgi:hypothetical protein